MKKKKHSAGVSDILLLALSAIFLIGSLTFFSACGPKDDGSWMTCHWAGSAVAGIAAVLTVIALIHLFLSDAKIKAGLSIAAIPAALLAMILPDNIIGLCMMDTMRCHTVMLPGAVVMSILVIAAAAFDIFIQLKRE